MSGDSFLQKQDEIKIDIDCERGRVGKGGPKVFELVKQGLQEAGNNASRKRMSGWVEIVVCRERMIFDTGRTNLRELGMQNLKDTENSASTKQRSE